MKDLAPESEQHPEKTRGSEGRSAAVDDDQSQPLSSEMRSWVDNCLVPLLIRECLIDLKRQNRLDSGADAVADSRFRSILLKSVME
jgi:hypothetical protein